MKISYRKAQLSDAELLINIYNAAFYSDYVKYGECPAYGRTKEHMEKSISKYTKQIILCDEEPVGVLSLNDMGNEEYYIGCLCVIPSYQGKGLGSKALQYIDELYPNWRKLMLITPADKEENIQFYTVKNGFRIDGEQMDGKVCVKHFVKQRNK